MNAIYMPEDPRYKAIREAVLGAITDVVESRKRNDLMGQIQGFMDVLNGRESTSLSSIDLANIGGTPSPGAGISPSGGVDLGSPSAPAITTQQPGDIVSAMSQIKDPRLFMGLLPTALDYNYKTKSKEDPVVKMEFTRKNDDGSTSKRTFNVRMSQQAAMEEKMANAGWEAGEIIPPKMTLKENKKTGTYWAIPEEGKGQAVDTGIKYDKESPETWSQWKDPKTGTEYNISSRGKKEQVSGQEKPPSSFEADNRIAGIDKAIFSLQTKGGLEDTIMAQLAESNPGLAGVLKGDPKDVIKTLESQKKTLLPYASKEVQERYKEPKPGNTPRVLTDPEKARAYLKAAGGDKDKARELARKDGWTF